MLELGDSPFRFAAKSCNQKFGRNQDADAALGIEVAVDCMSIDVTSVVDF